MQLTSDSIDWKFALCLLLLAVTLGFKIFGGGDESTNTSAQTSSAFSEETVENQSSASSEDFSQSRFVASTSQTPEQTKVNTTITVDSPNTIATNNATNDIAASDIEGQDHLPSGGEVDVEVVFEKWLSSTFDIPNKGGSNTSSSSSTGTASITNGSDSADDASLFDEDTDFAPDIVITTATNLEVQSERIETTKFSIAGRVISTHGGPIEGLSINAQLRGALSSEKASAAGTTQPDGSFSLAQLPAGDYLLRVEGNETHESASQIVRAGDTSALIELVAIKQWQVNGTVTDNLGTPIAAVTVRPPAGAEPTTTDAGGAFSMQFAAQDSGGLLIRYEAEGFTSTLRHIVGNELKIQGTIDASVQMQSNGALFVSGNVTNAQGEPIPRAYISLRSRNPAFERSAHTNDAGYFVLPEIVSTQSASINVSAGYQYQPFVLSNVTIQEDYDFTITLENAANTSLMAMVTDSEGNGISTMNFLSLSSAPGSRSQMATSDNTGKLVMENVKPGKLMLRSTAESPNIVIKGIDVIAGESNEHKVVVDIGPYTLHGRILDESGNAVSAADLIMVHVINENGVESVTTRKVKSEDDGNFVFSGLGTGERYITIASSAHDEQSFALDPSIDTNGEPIVLY